MSAPKREHSRKWWRSRFTATLTYMRYYLRLWAVPLLLVGCSAKDAVLLSVRIYQGDLVVSNGAFGSSVAGSFEVALTVGPEASGSSTVTQQSFALQTEAGASLVDVLMVDSDSTFPVVVGKGETKTVKFSISPVAVDHDAACVGKLKILGSFGDSLNGANESAQSDPIMPTCGAAT